MKYTKLVVPSWHTQTNIDVFIRKTLSCQIDNRSPHIPMLQWFDNFDRFVRNQI